MTIKDALKKYRGIEIELLLSHILGKSKEFVLSELAHELTPKQTNQLTRMAKRRAKREPMAYILGYKDFYGLRFKVNKNVLVPRPETEAAVDLVVNNVILNSFQDPKQVRNDRKKIKILDVGTGSGCIIISLAKTFDGGQIDFHASDVSRKALSIAKTNSKNHRTKIKFHSSDLLKNIKINPDIIIANLPYGWNGWENNTSVETAGLKFEPKQALFTKENGLYEIRRLLEQVSKLKIKPKLIYLEFDPRQKQLLQKLVKKYLPKAEFKAYKDFNNFWRYAEIKNFIF